MAFGRRKRNKHTTRRKRRAQDKKQEQYAKATKGFISSYHKTLPGIINTFENLMQTYPCAQFQYIIMDLKAIRDHLTDLKANGPRRPMRERPLEESEIPMQESDLPADMRGMDPKDLEIQEGPQ